MKTLILFFIGAISALNAQEYFYYWYADFGGAYHVTLPDNSTSGSMVSLEDVGGWANSIQTTNPPTCLVANYNFTITRGVFDGSNNSGKSPAYINLNGNAMYFGVNFNANNTVNKRATAYFQFQRSGSNIDAPVSFSIYDVNSNGCSASEAQKFIDEVEIYGITTSGTTIHPILSTTSSNVSISGNIAKGGVTSGGTLSALNVNFATGINQLYIIYRSGLGYPWNYTTCGSYSLTQQTTATDPKSQYIVITPIQTNYDCSVAPLAVDYLGGSLDCEKGGKKLNWRTSNEFQTDRFEIYGVSSDSNYLISTVKANGNSLTEQLYEINLYTEFKHLQIYEVDLNGNKVKLEDFFTNECDDDQIQIYPNPAQNNIQIKNINTQKYSKIEIYSYNGAKILEKELTQKIESFNIQDLSPGTYFIKCTGNQKIITLPFIKL